MANITRQQTRYMTRAEFDVLDKTTVDVGTEICIVDQIQKEDLSTDLQNAITKAEGALPATGGAITGDLSVSGNLTVNGTTTTIESTTLKVKDKLIEVASDNTVALTTPAGLVAPKYDGTNSGALVFDSTGTAFVGDVVLNAEGNIDVTQSQLQPLATRNLSANDDGKLVKWDEANKTLVAYEQPVTLAHYLVHWGMYDNQYSDGTKCKGTFLATSKDTMDYCVSTAPQEWMADYTLTGNVTFRIKTGIGASQAGYNGTLAIIAETSIQFDGNKALSGSMYGLYNHREYAPEASTLFSSKEAFDTWYNSIGTGSVNQVGYWLEQIN